MEVKYTHKVTLLSEGVRGIWFKSSICGGKVFCSGFTRPDGSQYAEPDIYEHHDDLGDKLTPELWYDDHDRWLVEKLVQFKGNK